MEELERKSSFVVVQTGARRGYAVPEILHRAGMLDRFYTDFCGNVGPGRWLALLRVVPHLRAKFRRLAARRVPHPLREYTITFGGPLLAYGWRLLRSAGDPAARIVAGLKFEIDWGRAMIRAGFGEATHVFTMLGEGHPFVAEARRRGLKVVVEIYILLSTQRLLVEERRKFPDWEREAPDYFALRRQFVSEEVLIDHRHFYICPSDAVREDLIAHWGICRERTALVPYGMDPRWLELTPQPQHGRILFAGTADLRKGVQYLAQAAEKLKNRGRRYDFRVAGDVSDSVRRQPVCQHLNFLGRVPRDRIHEEFQRADLFVLPSLAEGSAEVTYEALAAGVPLVVTQASGSVARDGVEGIIVPERDAAALADAVERLVENRTLRGRMATAARERAREYTWDRYGERLLAALKDAI